MEKNKISIIIIIYNVSPYIERCLQSVISQTYSNLEIILVVGVNEKGADDGCLSICKRYATRDNRIKLITCLAAGVSDARNRGLLAATGEYIGFVDGDDFIENDMYSSMMQLIVRNRAQIAVCGRFYEYKNTSLQDEAPENGPRIMKSEEALEMVLSGSGFYLHCWDKLYKAELWEGITFPEDRYVEDRVVVNKLLGKARRIVYDSTPKYHFRERSQSMSKTGEVAKNNTIANQELAQYIYNKFPRLTALCDKYLIYEYITAIQNVYLSGDVNKDEIKIYKTELSKLAGLITINPYMDWRLQAKLILALNAPRLLAINTKRKNKKISKNLIKYQ